MISCGKIKNPADDPNVSFDELFTLTSSVFSEDLEDRSLTPITDTVILNDLKNEIRGTDTVKEYHFSRLVFFVNKECTLRSVSFDLTTTISNEVCIGKFNTPTPYTLNIKEKITLTPGVTQHIEVTGEKEFSEGDKFTVYVVGEFSITNFKINGK